jgi:hypothetical protein
LRLGDPADAAKQREDMQMNSAHFAFNDKAARTGHLPGGLGYALAAMMALACGASTAAAQNE